MKEGALLWNKAFEKIGIKNAIVVKQMPDDAEWDPADVRYNTIRWIVQPESAYAVGPSRANPYTGELYDADIRISNDYVRFYFDDYKNFIDPILSEKSIEEMWHEDHHHHLGHVHEPLDFGRNATRFLQFPYRKDDGTTIIMVGHVHEPLVFE